MISLAPGILLIANPFLKDPNFMRTVIFLCDHQAEGSFGFVLNKKIPQTVGELVTDLEGYEMPVYYGGPVQMNTIHFLHQYPNLVPGGEKVFKEIYWGGNFESLVPSIKNNDINPDRMRFFLGYSGWSGGQLEEEMKQQSWLTAEATRKLIFHTNPEDVWKDSLKHLGGEYEMMINFPIDPQLN